MDARFEATLGNLDGGHQLHQLFVISDCLADVLGLDEGFLCFHCLITCDFEYFTNKVLNATCHENASTESNSVTVAS